MRRWDAQEDELKGKEGPTHKGFTAKFVQFSNTDLSLFNTLRKVHKKKGRSLVGEACPAAEFRMTDPFNHPPSPFLSTCIHRGGGLRSIEDDRRGSCAEPSRHRHSLLRRLFAKVTCQSNAHTGWRYIFSHRRAFSFRKSLTKWIENSTRQKHLQERMLHLYSKKPLVDDVSLSLSLSHEPKRNLSVSDVGQRSLSSRSSLISAGETCLPYSRTCFMLTKLGGGNGFLSLT